MPDLGASLVSAVLAELAGVYSQHRRTLRLTTVAGEDVLLAESLRGEEELSRGFRLQVSALSQDAGIALKSLLGQPVLVELLTAGAVARPLHGYVTAVELAGANGGFARYHLTVEPWTAFLRVGRDSRVFQDQTVLEILDTVFKAYEGKGKLMPSWRFDVRERDVYPERSLTTQYQESDLAFAERLMSEEGLFYFFEHEGDPDSTGFGRHTLVIADHNGAFKPNAQTNVRYTQPGAVMKEDSIDRWRTELRLRTNAVELSSWDYRSRGTRNVNSAAQEEVSLTSRDAPGVYAYQSRAQGERIAENQLQALQAKKEVHVGAGTVRTLSAGTRFTLQGHSRYDSEFVIVRVCHMAHNNLQADTDSALTRTLGECTIKAANLAELGASLHAARRGAGERPVYRNRIDAIPSAVPYRSGSRHARPTVHGQQTAIVVGPAGSVIHTDRDHRIKVQFHWQRGNSSHNRLTHPSPDGHTGAPADDGAGTWVRVATPLAPVAGANWGSHALPRVGQEVLVDFFEGNIDRPVVIGALYNGAGQTDAQNNKAAYGAGAATGNAPAWFPGQAGAHGHPAALSGIKSQAMQSSQSGAGAYSQLVIDDSANEARIALQRHATAHQGTAELNLGHLRHQTDNQRLQAAGFGAELKTEHSTALRAGRGMLLSADRASTGSAQLDSRPAAGQIEQAAQLHTSLAETAQKHNARLAGEEAADKLPAIAHVKRSGEVISASGGDGAGHHGSSGSATEYSEAQLQLSAPSGIAALTPASAVITAGTTSAIGAGQDINFAAQGGSFHVVRAGISLFTYGKATNASKPNQETGIRLHAASGKVSSQSQSGPTRLTADKGITVASVTKSVNVAAREHVLLTAQGAFLKLEGGNIMLHGPGKIEFKASMKELAGPQRCEVAMVTFPNSILNCKGRKGYRFSR